MPEPPKIYWDACIFLSYINGDADRLPDIDAYLDRSGKDIHYRSANTDTRCSGQRDQSPKARSAIHMATARHIGVDEIHTYDDNTWKKYEKILGIKVIRPRFRNLQYTLDDIFRPDLAHLPRGPWDDIDAWPAHPAYL